MSAKVAVIGSGFAGISAATSLAHEGLDVFVYEKNADVGGRARQFQDSGFTFDMGPSWYWMPDVFESYFNRFGKSASDYYKLELLDPGFTMVFGEREEIVVPSNFEALCDLFEGIEKGSADKLRKFMIDAEYKYVKGINDLVHKPSHSVFEFMRWDILKGMVKLQLLSSFSKHVKSYFKDPRLVALMEFPVLFLGAMPENTPALYSLMNYAGLKLGTWYPMGGFGKVIEGMKSLAEEQGVTFYTSEPVQGMSLDNSKVSRILANGHSMDVNGVIGAADYNHIEQKLLPKEKRNYTPEYWDKKVFAPSCLLFYLGVKGRVDKLGHHTLFFDEDLREHAVEIYQEPRWPTKPLFYVCCPSKTDPSVAPEGHENLFVLMPIAPGLEDSEQMRQAYFERLMGRLEEYTGTDIRSNIVVERSYCVDDFVQDYNAYKGNAYGLANTLSQTAFLKPKMRSKKLENLYFAGQLTTPGPGVPPSLISGQVAAGELINYLS